MRLTANYNRQLTTSSKTVSKHLNQPRIYVSTQGSYRNDKCCTPRRWTWLRRRGGTVCSRAAAFGNRSRVRIRVSRSDAHARTSRKSTNVHRGNTEGTAWEQRGTAGRWRAGASLFARARDRIWSYGPDTTAAAPHTCPSGPLSSALSASCTITPTHKLGGTV